MLLNAKSLGPSDEKVYPLEQLSIKFKVLLTDAVY